MLGFCVLRAQEEAPVAEGVAFPMRIDWLSARSSPIGIERPRGLSLLSPDYVTLNTNILKINFAGLKATHEIDATGNNLIFTNQMDGTDLLYPQGVSLSDYYALKIQNNLRFQLSDLCRKGYIAEKTAVRSEKLELIGADIAGQRVSLRVAGNVNINGRLQSQNQSQVRTGYRDTRSTTFIVDQKQQLNIEGKIGDRISILVDQDSERDFDFENNLRIIYTGQEDDIVQKIEAGNVALALPSTQFVTFSGKNNGLFGLKALLKLGALDITTIASVEKGKKEKLSVDGGAQKTEATIKDSDYRKNLYFFLDRDFRDKFYQGFHENGGVFVYDPNSVISNLEVYKSTTTEQAGCVYGYAYIDPNQQDADTNYIEQRFFMRMEPDRDYTYNLDLGFIRMSTMLQDNEILAVTYRVVNSQKQTLKAYGSWNRALTDTSDITLKLIKPQQMLPAHPCWDLEFKNVYYLGATGIDEQGFDLQIVYIHAKEGKVERDPLDGISFLQKFGLDMRDKNNSPNPDEIVDINPAILNLQAGELWIPYLRPFQVEQNDLSGTYNPNLDTIYSCTAMYNKNRTDYSAINEDSKFEIVYKYENRSSIINLGAMIIEGSESVQLGGETLTRGVDYTIDYFSGTLTLLRVDATNPDQKLDIKYERNQFFQLDKKTILGVRAQYDFGDNSFIGATALYFGQSVIDEKVDIGYEPMRNFVWDMNGKFSQNLPFLTRAINWLPLIKADQMSSLSFEGEIARVNPNPNTLSNEATGDPDGVGFIDDFESSKRITSPPIMQRYWSHSAAPPGRRENQRGFMFWYNPYGGVATKNIWPNKEVSTQAQNNITEIMVMVLDPQWSIEVADNACTPQEAWGGITYSFPSSYYDQSKSKYLEIWVRGKKGRLHVDLGQISEDVIPNRKLDTEDQPVGGFRNDLVDKGEDTGIDGQFDTDEYIITSRGTLHYGDDRLETVYKRNKEDPHSDNWKWSEGSTNYRYINGTENNYERDARGNIPNSEDLDRDYTVDLVNDYYTADFSLDDEVDNDFVAGRTQFENGRPTGWKLYRIPLTDFKKINPEGNITWQTIESCRLWFDGTADEDTVMIAKIEMVGNEWEVQGIATTEGRIYEKRENAFEISVINSEDNPDTYKAPKGVEGEYDRINEIRMKEQSLVLWFNGSEGIKPGEIAAAKKVLLEEASFITYRKMKLFINGHDIHSRTKYYQNKEKTPLQFFIRFGRGGQNPQYYEYRQSVYPGWDKKNYMEIDLDFVTSLKGYNSEIEFPDHEINPKQFRIIRNEKGEIIQRRWREVENGSYTGMEIIIYGEPAISRVQQLEIGLINQKYALDDYDQTTPLPRYDNTVFGEVWIDELRLSEVRRDPGVAYRTNMALDIAGVARLNISMSQQDADFHTVEQRPSLQPSGLNTNQNFSANGSFSLDKLTPASWGLRLPVSGSYTNHTGIPKYVPGTDILTGDSPPDSIMDLSKSYGFNTSISKRGSDYWLTKYTIDQLSLGFNAQWAERSNVMNKLINSENYQGNVSYRVPFGTNNYFQPFKWLQPVPLLGDKLGELHWYYTPNNLQFTANASENKSRTVSRTSNNITPSYDLNMSNTILAGYKMLENLSMNYSRTMQNNLNDLRYNKIAIIQDFNFGIPINIAESYNASFTPKIFSWFTPSLNYNANYNWSEQAHSQTPYIDQLSNQNRITGSFSLNPASIIKIFYSPKSEKQTTSAVTSEHSPRSGKGSTATQVPDETTSKEPAKSKEIPLLENLFSALGHIDPIQISGSQGISNRNNFRIGNPSLAYRMGLTYDPGIKVDTVLAGTNLDNVAISNDFSLRSGIKITNDIRSNLSFNQNSSWTEAQGINSRTFTRDYLTYKNKGKDGIPFPSYSISWSQVEKIWLLSKVFKKLSLDHGFSGKEAKNYRNGEVTNSSYQVYFQPLIGLTMQITADLNATARMSQGKTINNLTSGTEIVREKNINATLNYQKRGGLTIPLPFLKDKRLENTITFTMNFDYGSSITRACKAESTKFSVQQENRNWKIEPRVTYSFTQKVTGGIFYSYGESFNARTGKRITRNGGFDINIAISG